MPLLVSEEAVPCKPPSEFKEQIVETDHKLAIDGKVLPYTARAGNLILKNEAGEPKASVFFTSFTKEKQNSDRPITFCFNGGPGSASVWLNLGSFGPKRIVANDQGTVDPPYSYEDNPNSLLDFTDLVFIDPVSTGYSCAAPGEDVKKFHGVEEDVKSVAEFIRLYTTRYQRWDSPKFIAGESYGTTRAAAVAEHLHDEYYLYLNGLVLVSSALNFQTFRFDEGNDLPYILFLPSYTATAWAHQKLNGRLQENLEQALDESTEFAMGPYATALLKGDRLSQIEREEIIDRLHTFTGLSPTLIERNRLRIPLHRFTKELLRDKGKLVGRFDGRVTGFDTKTANDFFPYDPSQDFIFGAFTSAFQTFLERDLNWKDDRVYRVLSNVWPWDFGSAKNRYLNVSSALQQVMTRNPHLHLFVASGLFDLATPFLATQYTLEHLGLNSNVEHNVEHKLYPGGHMMYLQKPNQTQLTRDLREYYRRAVPAKKGGSA